VAIPAQVRAVHQLADLGVNVESFCATLIENAEVALDADGHPLTSQIGTEQGARWLASIRGACEPQHATERHLAAFAAGYDAESARAVTDWYTSETGARLLQLERAAATTDWDAEVSPFIDQIVKEPVPIERVKLFERIDEATQSTADAAELQAGITSILTYSLQPLLPPADRTPPELIDEQLTALRAHLTQQLRGQQSIIFMFVYRGASDAELAAFADFSESAPARWLHTNHRMAMLQLVAELREAIVAELGGA